MNKGTVIDILEYGGASPGTIQNYSVSLTIEVLENPPWEEYQKTHCWRNYVPDCLKLNWSDLSDESRIIIWALCEVQANKEEWD